MRWGGRPRKREMENGSGRDQKTLLYGPYPQSSDSQQRQAPYPRRLAISVWRHFGGSQLPGEGECYWI